MAILRNPNIGDDETWDETDVRALEDRREELEEGADSLADNLQQLCNEFDSDDCFTHVRFVYRVFELVGRTPAECRKSQPIPIAAHWTSHAEHAAPVADCHLCQEHEVNAGVERDRAGAVERAAEITDDLPF